MVVRNVYRTALILDWETHVVSEALHLVWIARKDYGFSFPPGLAPLWGLPILPSNEYQKLFPAGITKLRARLQPVQSYRRPVASLPSGLSFMARCSSRGTNFILTLPWKVPERMSFLIRVMWKTGIPPTTDCNETESSVIRKSTTA